jgi:SET domain-containing protein
MLTVLASDIAGRGVFAVEAIPARKKIGEIDGERVDIKEMDRRVEKLHVIYMIQLDAEEAIDCSKSRTPLKRLNHSCAPNTRMQFRRKRAEIFALREIKPGEELTLDYGITHHSGELKCKCGAANCRGFI